MTLQQINNEANNLLKKEFDIIKVDGTRNILSLSDYSFHFDSAKKRAGICRYNRKKISLSIDICRNNLDRDDEIMDTLLHEIAHALSYKLYGRQAVGHGYLWKHIAKQVGAKPQRCYTSRDYKPVKGKYTATCSSCGHTRDYHKKLKLSRSCGKCNPKRYDPKYKLTITKNW